MTQDSDTSTDGPTDSPIVNRLFGYRYWFGIFIAMLFMVAIRVQSYESLFTENGIVFPGNDPWYHYRMVMYTVNHWPFTLGFDPRSGYPVGAAAGTFGTLYDQILATVALVVGLGDPSAGLVRRVMIFSSPVFAALTTIPVYFLSRDLSNSRRAGLLSVGLLALMPGIFLNRSLVGVADHNAAEPLFLFVALYLLYRVFVVAEDSIILPEVVREFDMDDTGFRSWMFATLAAAGGLAAYFLMWPPAVMVFGLLAVTLTLYTLLQYSRNATAQPVLVSSAVVMLVVSIVTLVDAQTFGFRPNVPSLFHATLAGATFIGTVFLIGSERVAETRDVSTSAFVGSILTLAVAGLGTLWLTVPTVVDRGLKRLIRILGLESGGAVGTIGEEQALTINQLVFSEYGLTIVAFIVALFVLVAEIARCYSNDEPFGGRVFMFVVAVFVAVISVQNARFNYYFAPMISVFTGYGTYAVLMFIGFPDSFGDMKGYQLLAYITVFSMLVPILLAPPSTTAIARSDNIGTQSYQDWQEPLDWMSENTPEPSVERYPSRANTGYDYEYTNQSSGVMSWWDYGHWITVTGDRIPVANPFQQHANAAAHYLLAKDVESAEQEVSTLSNEDENIDYLMVDWQMISVYSKFSAPVVFHDTLQTQDMYTRYFIQAGGQLRPVYVQPSQRYYESLMVQMYLSHGSRIEPGPFVVDYEVETLPSGRTIRVLSGDKPIKVFDTVEQARSYAQSKQTVSFGGVGRSPKESVEAIEHYRLVKSSSTSAFNRSRYVRPAIRMNRLANSSIQAGQINPNPSTVKLFERVPGAQLNGTDAPPNSTLEVSVRLIDTTTGNPFVYEQHVDVGPNGTFSTTVPYATTGYERASAETTIQALGSYQVRTLDGQFNGSVAVSERAVVTENTDPISVTVTPVQAENSTTGNSTAG